MARSTSPVRGFTGLSPLEQQRHRALLSKITQFEARGAILPADARTLRSQLHDSTSGHWKAVELRLQQLALNWNPYQDGTTLKSAEKEKKLNFYELLALENEVDVSTDDVKRQMGKLALLLHPDKKWMNRKRETRLDADSTQFARLRLAYESDPKRRMAYDAKLLEALQPQQSHQLSEVVKGQVKLDARRTLGPWCGGTGQTQDGRDGADCRMGQLLSLNATELRFETGEPCSGK